MQSSESWLWCCVMTWPSYGNRAWCNSVSLLHHNNPEKLAHVPLWWFSGIAQSIRKIASDSHILNLRSESQQDHETVKTKKAPLREGPNCFNSAFTELLELRPKVRPDVIPNVFHSKENGPFTRLNFQIRWSWIIWSLHLSGKSCDFLDLFHYHSFNK